MLLGLISRRDVPHHAHNQPQHRADPERPAPPVMHHDVRDNPGSRTCTGAHTHLGWFGSFNESGPRKLVVVVLLTGGNGVAGAVAAQLAGDIYKELGHQNYFAKAATPAANRPFALITTPMCCALK